MGIYIPQTYAPQAVVDFYKGFGYRGLQQYNLIYAGPVIQQQQLYRDPTVQQHINTTYLIPQPSQIYGEDVKQHAQIYIQQDAINRKLREEEQPSLQPATQAHVCDICNKTFKSKSGFLKHHAGHTGEYAHICDVCHKGFFWKSELRTHYFIHTGDKHHVCEVCNKGFSQKSHLRSHYLTHTDYKPYVCEICNKGFTQKSNLRRHYLIHTEYKPYVCEICNERFTDKSYLSQHSLIHTDQKPLVSNIYQQRHFYKSSLQTNYHVHSADQEDKRENKQIVQTFPQIGHQTYRSQQPYSTNEPQPLTHVIHSTIDSAEDMEQVFPLDLRQKQFK